MASNTSPLPWPGWLDIALVPRAYLALLYQIAGLPLAIAGFSWWASGLGLSLGLTFIGLGIFLGFAFLVSIRGLALVQGRIAGFLAGQVPIESYAPLQGQGFWQTFKALLLDPGTWLAQVYVLLRLPLGLAGFTSVIALLSVSSSLILVAGLHWATSQVGSDGLAHLQAFGASFTFDPGDLTWPAGLAGMHGFGRVVVAAAGVLGVLGSLHLALALAWLDGQLAKVLLTPQRPRPSA